MNTTSGDVSAFPTGTTLGRSDSVWGFTDLYPVASIAWNSGVHNWMTYVTGDIPVGAYDSKRLAKPRHRRTSRLGGIAVPVGELGGWHRRLCLLRAHFGAHGGDA
jgi:hypothetical protein